MKRNFVFLFGMFAVVLLSSCRKDTESATPTIGAPIPAEVLNPLLIDAQKTDLADTDAAQVMKLFLCRENPDEMTRSSFVDKAVDNTFPIDGDNGEPLAYVVNYEGGGYGIVSATKKYSPILAFSDEGRLSPASLDGNGIALWVASITADIADTKSTLMEDSPEYFDTRLQWREYEKPEPVSAAASTMQDANYWYMYLRNQMMISIGYCTRDRYNFYRTAGEYGSWYGDYQNTMEREFRELDHQLSVRYDPINIPPCMIWGDGLTSNDEDKIMPLLKTYWDQEGNPYDNQMEPKDSGRGYKPVGCGPIAVAQIMNYYKYPATLNGISIDWSKTQEKIASISNTEIPKLLKVVNRGLNSINQDTKSTSTPGDAQNFFNNNGYSAPHYTSSIESIIITEIQNRRPVFMAGTSPGEGGHGWVCDGYLSKSHYYWRCVNFLFFIVTN